MLRREIPSTREALPVIGLGTWKTFDVSSSDFSSRTAVLRRFVELEGTLVDSSAMYGRSEAVVGELAMQTGVHRQLFLATKVWIQGEHAGIAQMEDSFRKLRTDRIDLMQVHNLVDVETHLRTLREWKAAGRIRYIGLTHWTVDSQRDLLAFVSRPEIDFIQCNFSLAVRDAERELLPRAADHGIATLINRPFENGGLFRRVAKMPLPDVARVIGCTTWAQLFLKYVISHPAVTCVIPATADVEHLQQNMAAGSDPLPDASMRAEIAAAWERASALAL